MGVKWKTRDGRLIPLHHMTDTHIAHCIAMIEREGHWRLAALPVLKQEQVRRKTASPTPEEIFARAVGEVESALWREENLHEEGEATVQ